MQTLLHETSYWCWIFMVLVSLYHAYRGFMVQWIYAHQQNLAALKDFPEWRKWSDVEIVMIRSIEDAFFHLVCSVAGFLALLVADYLWKSHGQCEAIDTGASILIVFSFLIGIIGVSGQLPPIIQKLAVKVPWSV